MIILHNSLKIRLLINFVMHFRIVSILKPVGAMKKIAKRKILSPFRIAQAIIKDGSLQKELNWTHTMHKAISDTCATKEKR